MFICNQIIYRIWRLERVDIHAQRTPEASISSMRASAFAAGASPVSAMFSSADRETFRFAVVGPFSHTPLRSLHDIASMALKSMPKDKILWTYWAS